MSRTVLKTDILIEPIPVANSESCIRFYKAPNSPYSVKDIKAIPEAPTDIEEVIYSIVEVADKEENIIYYAVRDRDIFETILKISEARLEQIKRQAYSEGKRTGWYDGMNFAHTQTIKEVKKLSWWRRLFNKF